MEAREQQKIKQYESVGESLRKKWASTLKGIENPTIARSQAMLHESEAEYLQGLNEDTTTSNVGTFINYIFPILRRVFPNLISHEIMSVQPMTGPIGAVFFYEMKHANTKGGQVVAGDNMIEVFSEHYTAEYQPEEPVATGNGVLVTFAHDLAWIPVRRLDTTYGIRTMVTDGVETLTDNGSGVFVGSAGGSGTINYTTGAISVTFNVAPLNNAAITVSYYYDSEGNAQVPEMYLDISIQEIKAKSRKIKALWSAEAADDIKKLHGIEMETEILAGFANEMALEIDRENIDLLVSGAQHTTTWTYTNPANSARELDAIRNLLTTLSAMSAKIHKTTKRAPANFIVTTPEVLALLEQLATHGDYQPAAPTIERAPSYGAIQSDAGVYLAGVLGKKWRVFIDPYLSASSSTKTILMGLKGRNFYDAGAAYCPYIPLEVTASFTDPHDFTTRKGMRTRYANKMLRPEYYGTIAVSGLPSF